MCSRYIQAATTPKDIIILLDTSGSMKGFAFDVAIETVKKILDTLTDDDFFNIISVSLLIVSDYVHAGVVWEDPMDVWEDPMIPWKIPFIVWIVQLVCLLIKYSFLILRKEFTGGIWSTRFILNILIRKMLHLMYYLKFYKTNGDLHQSLNVLIMWYYKHGLACVMPSLLNYSCAALILFYMTTSPSETFNDSRWSCKTGHWFSVLSTVSLWTVVQL